MFCEICTETKDDDEMFEIPDCKHFFCKQCINNHIDAKLHENVCNIKCPAADCGLFLDFHSCNAFVSQDVLSKWDRALCEFSILDSQKVYCPFKDCSAVILKDDTDEVIKESVCPDCWRLFCAECEAPWHSEMDCEEFQAAWEGENERDFMVSELAKKMGWSRCPRCRFYVEKIDGCIHITCRCGFEFCYACGGNWNDTHACDVQG